MRNLKKVLSLTLALVMLIGMMVVGAGAATFADTVDSDKQEAIEVTSAAEIILGRDTNTFDPDGTLSRQEAAAIIARVMLTKPVLDKVTTADCQFTDVDADWAKAAVQVCASSGVINGVGGNKFDPTSKVTGVQFAKMLMCVLDDTKDYTLSSNWKLDVQRDAMAAGLDANNVPMTDAALSREDAAQMAFNAIKYSPSGEKTYKVGNLTFDNFLEAYIAAGQKIDKITTSTASDSLAKTRFNLTQGTKTDDFGRTVKTWSVGKDEVYASVANEVAAAVTYTEKKTASDLAKELKGYSVVTKKTGNADQSVGISETCNSGYEAEILFKNNSTSSGLFTSTSKTKLSEALAELTGNGTTVEIYATDKVINKIVVIEEKVGTVTKVTAAKGDDARKVTVAGLTFETEDFARGDVVLYNLSNGKIVSMKLAEVVEDVAVERYATNSVTTADGKYEYSANAASGTIKSYSINGTQTYTFYFDSCGYVIMNEGYAADASGDYVFVKKVGTSLSGDSVVADSYLNVAVMALDGTESVVKVAAATTSALNDRVNKLCTMADDNDNEDFVTLTPAETHSNAAVTKIGSYSALSNTNATVADGVVANGTTAFFLKTGTNKYTHVTGIANVPGYTAKATTDNITAQAIVKKGFAVAVYIDVSNMNAETGETDSSDLIYVFSASPTETGYDADAKKTYYVYTAVVDGEVTTIQSTQPSLTTIGLVTPTYDKNGFVTNTTATSAASFDFGSTVGQEGIISYSDPVLSLNKFFSAAKKAVYTIDLGGKIQADLDTKAIDDVIITWATDVDVTMGAFVATYNAANKNYTATYDVTNTRLTLTAKEAGTVTTAPTTTTGITVTEATAGANTGYSSKSVIVDEDAVVYMIDTADKTVDVITVPDMVSTDVLGQVYCYAISSTDSTIGTIYHIV